MLRIPIWANNGVCSCGSSRDIHHRPGAKTFAKKPLNLFRLARKERRARRSLRQSLTEHGGPQGGQARFRGSATPSGFRGFSRFTEYSRLTSTVIRGILGAVFFDLLGQRREPSPTPLPHPSSRRSPPGVWFTILGEFHTSRYRLFPKVKSMRNTETRKTPFAWVEEDDNSSLVGSGFRM